MTKLYHHKTDGGAEYLTDTFITWSHNGKRGKEGTITSETKICVRLDGQPELMTANDHDCAALLEALEQIAASPEEGHPANLLKMIAVQALEREPTMRELIAESEIDALEPGEESDD